MSFPKLGNLAPNFSLLNQRGETIALKAFKGKSRVVVYFYPKASTPGCTVQACGLRDYAAEFKALNTVILGVSPDAPAKLQKFDDKFMGREFMGIIRTSFIIDEAGRLAKILEKVNTKTHNDDLIAYIKNIS